jgi:threonine aldolase
VRILLPVETNMLWIDPEPLGFPLDVLRERAKRIGITLSGSRLVCHVQTSSAAVDDLLELVKTLKEEHAKEAQGGTKEELERWQGFAKGQWSGRVPKPVQKRLATTAYAAK